MSASTPLLECISTCPECIDGEVFVGREAETGAWLSWPCARCQGTGWYVPAVQDPETGEWLVLDQEPASIG